MSVTSPAPTETPPSKSERFLVNVLWSWANVMIPLVAGVFLSRYIIVKLGVESYGVWALTYSIVGYYGFFDIGFRAANVRYTAYYVAREEWTNLNVLINTLLFYFSCVTVILLGATWALYKYGLRLFQVTPELRDDFGILVLIIGIGVAFGVNLNVFSGVLEGFQRFDVLSRIRILGMAIRTGGAFALLFMGYKLVAMGVLALVVQFGMAVGYYYGVRRVYPRYRLSVRESRWSMMKQLFSYGVHNALASLSDRTVEQLPSILIGHFRPAAFVGFFSLPIRMLQYAVDAVSRVAQVTQPAATEYVAHGKTEEMQRLGIYTNRYSLVLMVPIALALLGYGRELILLWVGPEFAEYSTPLLIWAVPATIWATAQFSTNAILFAMAKQRALALSMAGQAVFDAVALFFVIPAYGILGAAILTSCTMFLVRGLVAPWLLCRETGFGYLRYMWGIYGTPMLTAVPAFFLVFGVKRLLWPGDTWIELGLGIGLSCAAYLALSAFTSLQAHHRELILRWAGSKLGFQKG
jgi:O-antigen/teichoic acid export membrane protein